MQIFARQITQHKKPNVTQMDDGSSPSIRNILRAGAGPKPKIGAVNYPRKVEADRVGIKLYARQLLQMIGRKSPLSRSRVM